MTPFIIAFLSLALLLGAFAYVAMPIGSRSRRAIVSGFFAILLGALFFGYSDMLGRPKPSRLEALQGGKEEARVIGSYMQEGKGIFLWLLPSTASEPRYYELPWDEKTASALQDAIEQNAQHHGGGVMMGAMGPAFERSWDKFEPKFYPLPQPKLPDKPYEAAPTQTYQGPEQGI